MCSWFLVHFFLAFRLMASRRLHRDAFPLALIQRVKAPIKPTHRKHNEEVGWRWRGAAVVWWSSGESRSPFSVLCHSQQIRSRCAALLNRLIYLFVYLFPQFLTHQHRFILTPFIPYIIPSIFNLFVWTPLHFAPFVVPFGFIFSFVFFFLRIH